MTISFYSYAHKSLNVYNPGCNNYNILAMLGKNIAIMNYV